MSSPTPPSISPDVTDPYGGFLSMTTYWRPNPEDPDPRVPGQKTAMAIYLPVRPDEACLCGSDKTYGVCCRPKIFWHPVAPDPNMGGYDFLAPQAATFRSVDGATLRERLLADPRLYCVEDRPEKAFWVYWGDPPVESRYGTYCFGDLELKRDATLTASATTARRMQNLLDLLGEIAGDCLGTPRMHYEPIPLIEKATGKRMQLPPPPRRPARPRLKPRKR